MKNPWMRLPERPPFVLPEDRQFIETFNGDVDDPLQIRTDLLPEPFLGRCDAPIVLLGLNPGWTPEDLAVHRKPSFRRRVLGCLRHDSPQPFYHLDPRCEGPGRRWWLRNLRHPVSEFGERRVADSTLCVEYFPYHSRSFNHSHLRLPSQEYSFQLVRDAIRRGAIVLQLRGARVWKGAVPELARYRDCYSTRTARTASISPRNCPDGYTELVRRIRASSA